MAEKQNIEYKSSWHHDHLKVICGFANANGGMLYIGKNDQGKTIGVKNHKELMETLPNKILDILGVVVKVNLNHEKSLHYIEIKVPPYSVPISLRGSYYFRSGSVKRELTGMALNEFMYKKMGKTWDEVIEDRAKLSDIDKKSVEMFLSAAAEAKRFPANEHRSLKELLEKLKLMEKGKLTRAALVMFAKDPMRFFPSMCVRIGRFGESKVDLRFHESVEGNLVQCLKEVIELLDHKFFISPISFKGLQRIEKWQYPLPALREVLLNSLIHKNYMGPHLQIEVYDDRICFWNPGSLPEELTVKSLKRQHSSYPRNLLIASTCFKGGYIDAWGRGIKKIMDACKAEGFPEPKFEERDGGFLATLFSGVKSRGQKDGPEQETETVGKKAGDKSAEKVRRKCGESAEKVFNIILADSFIKTHDISHEAGLSQRAVENAIAKLKEAGFLKRIGSARAGHWQVVE